MKKQILLLITILFFVSCSNGNYNEEFIGTWKKENSWDEIHFSKAENNQIRLKIMKRGGAASQSMIMEFEDKNTVRSTMGGEFANYYIYKLKNEDGKTYILNYSTNKKYFRKN